MNVHPTISHDSLTRVENKRNRNSDLKELNGNPHASTHTPFPQMEK
uniref:Uncharacterized protein n=1 Tax=Anguilla anguilla TaxID=7936 RepID=A0A0E9UPX3_ANGAN